MRSSLILGIMLLLAVMQLALAQEPIQADLEEQIIEHILDGLEQGVDISEFTERLRYYLTHRMDLNTATEAEFMALLFLSPLQVANLLAYRRQSGGFLSVIELQAVDAFDVQTVEKLQPFVMVRQQGGIASVPWRRVMADSEQQLMLRYARILEPQAGYQVQDSSRSRYLGDPNRYMLRYRMNFQNQLRLAINMEKDAGEPFFEGQQRLGFDHYGVSLQVQLGKTVKDVVVGDYLLQVGQGLVVWNGLSFGKGAMITSVARQGGGLRSYTSMNEFNYLRGASARISIGDLELIPFLSWRKLSGGTVQAAEGMQFISISMTGLHRTPNELANRNQIGQFVSGMDVSYRYQRLKVGAVAMHTRYNGIILRGSGLGGSNDFTGRYSTNVGVNYQATFRNVYIFGETAYQWAGYFANLHGLMTSLHPQISIFVTYRNYQQRYHSPFGQSLGEGTAVLNERGVYAGLSYRLGRQIEWMGYTDIFRFPGFRFRVDAPSAGVDVFSQFAYIWYKRGRLALRYRYRARQENSAIGIPERYLVDIDRHQGRLDFQYHLTKQWEIRSRCEFVAFEKEARRDLGRLIYQDLFFRPARFPVQGNLRAAYFSTDSFDARLYAYENDVLYASAFPLYNGKGWRGYVNARYQMSRNLDFWIRYSITRFSGAEEVGTGLETSLGPVRSELKLQFRYQW